MDDASPGGEDVRRSAACVLARGARPPPCARPLSPTCAKTVTAFAHQLARLIGPLHGSFSAGRQCPISGSPVSRHAQMRTSEVESASKFKVLVRFSIGDSSRSRRKADRNVKSTDQMSMIGSLGRCKGPVSRPSTSGIAAHKISRLIREGGRGRQCEAGPVAQARRGRHKTVKPRFCRQWPARVHPVPATGLYSGCHRTWTSPDYAVKSAMTAPNGPPSPAAGAACPRSPAAAAGSADRGDRGVSRRDRVRLASANSRSSRWHAIMRH